MRFKAFDSLSVHHSLSGIHSITDQFIKEYIGLSLKEERVGIVKEQSRGKSGCRAVTCRGMDAKAKTLSTASVRVFS